MHVPCSTSFLLQATTGGAGYDASRDTYGSTPGAPAVGGGVLGTDTTTMRRDEGALRAAGGSRVGWLHARPLPCAGGNCVCSHAPARRALPQA